MKGCIERYNVCCGCLIVAFLCIFLPFAQATSELALLPSTYLPAVDQDWTLALRVNDAQSLFSATAELQYPPNLLALVSVQPGDFLNSPTHGSATFVSEPSSPMGVVSIAIAAPQGHPGADGTGTLAIFQFRASAPGKITISILPQSVQLADATGTPLPPPNLQATELTIGRGVVLETSTSPVGASVPLHFAGLTAGEVVTAQFDGIAIPLGSSSVDFLGRLDTSFTVPEAAGGPHQLRFIASLSVWSDVVHLQVLPRIGTPQPSDVRIGDPVTLHVQGFASQEGLQLKLGPSTVEVEPDTAQTDLHGSATLRWFIPEMPIEGRLPVEVIGEQSGTSVRRLDALHVLPEFDTLIPLEGSVGTHITAAGRGFGANETLQLAWTGAPVETTTDAAGRWSVEFDLQPEQIAESRYGALVCVAQGTRTGQRATKQGFIYKPVGQIIALDPEKAKVGDWIEIRGVGFAAESPISLLFGSRPVTQFQDVNRIMIVAPTVPVDGQFTIFWQVPLVPEGDHQLSLTTGPNTQPGPHPIQIEPQITRVQARDGSQFVNSGIPGMLAIAEGNGFPPNVAVTLDMGSQANIAMTQTDSNGQFQVYFALREVTPGHVLITANSSDHAVTYRDFVISATADPSMVLASDEGKGRDWIRITGTGFPANSNIGTLTIHSVGSSETDPLALREHELGFPSGNSVFVDGRGAFDLEFEVPWTGNAATYGDKQIQLNLSQGDRLIQSFRVLPNMTASTMEVSPGDLILLSGTGFGAAEPVGIGIGVSGAEITGDPTLTSDSQGAWSLNYMVPDLPAGKVLLRAKGTTSQVEAALPLTVQPIITEYAKDPESSPGPLLHPGDEIRVAGKGFGPAERLQFDLGNAVNVPATESARTDAVGSFSTRILVPNQRVLGPSVRVRVTGLESGETVLSTNTLQVADRLLLEPTHGPAGMLIALISGEAITEVRIAGEITPIVQYTNDGAPMVRIRPDLPGGRYVVEAGNRAGTFTVDPQLQILSSGQFHTGDLVQIQGSGFAQRERVMLYSSWQRDLMPLLATESGSFQTSLSLPPLPGGQAALFAEGPISFASAPLRIVPRITSVRLAPDGSVLISGDGFGSREAVRVYVDGIPSPQQQVARDGMFGLSVSNSGSSTATTHTVQVLGSESGLQSLWMGEWLISAAALNVHPDKLLMGTTLIIEGVRFSPGEAVRLLIGPRDAQIIADAAGNFTFVYPIQEEFAAGAVPIHVLGMLSLIQAFHEGPQYFPSTGPQIASVSEDSEGKTLTAGMRLKVQAVLTENATPAVQGSFHIGETITGSLHDDGHTADDVVANDGIWSGVWTVPEGSLSASMPVSVTLVDVVGQTAGALSGTQVRTDALAEVSELRVPEQVLSEDPFEIEVLAEPGGEGTCRIDGLTDPVAISETEEGRYRAELSVSSAVTVQRACVLSFTDPFGNRTTRRSEAILIDTAAQVDETTVQGSPALPGETLALRLKAEAGGMAQFSIQRLISDKPLQETTPGEYVAEFRVPEELDRTETTLMMSFTDAYGHSVEALSMSVLLGAGVRSSLFRMTLREGLNLVAIPLAVPEIRTLGEWADHLGAGVTGIVWYDTDHARFRTYSPEISTTDIPLDPTRSYLVIMDSETELEYAGQPLEGTLSLHEGMNLIHVPLRDPEVATLRDLGDLLKGVQLIIRYNPDLERFESYTPRLASQVIGSLPVQGGEGLIVLMAAPRTVEFRGSVW